ncbi:MAG: ribosome biogenesis GTP-binding protein YihA/YsxC [Gemmatimonadaceae bacterium]
MSTANDPLVIRSVEFLGGMATVAGWRPANELPEIAFSGRSNVGKSSLINTLLRRKALARVSQTPGKTREINFFRVNEWFTLVDLPGYGYARVSKESRQAWQPLIETYLRTSLLLKGVVQLIDSRHGAVEGDATMLQFLADLGVPCIVVLTKTDKLARASVSTRAAEIARDLEMDEQQVVPFSAETGRGRDELAAAILSLIEQPDWRQP